MPALAEDAARQPLTRADCEKAGLTWNDNANVCGSRSLKAEGQTVSAIAPSVASQPLTRAACDQAGLHWDDGANVCGETSVGDANADAMTEPPAAPTIVVKIDKAAQEMTVSVDGEKRYHWPVSTGRSGYHTPSGTFTPTRMHKMWYSREWDDAPMPHAIFFTRNGHAIHGTDQVRYLGKPASHGCVRVDPQNASKLYRLVATNGLENTQVVLAGLTPYTERATPRRATSRNSAVRSSGSNSRYYRVAPRTDSAAPRKKRGGLFKRLFRNR